MSQLGSKTKSHFPSLHLWGGGGASQSTLHAFLPHSPAGAGPGEKGSHRGCALGHVPAGEGAEPSQSSNSSPVFVIWGQTILPSCHFTVFSICH